MFIPNDQPFVASLNHLLDPTLTGGRQVDGPGPVKRQAQTPAPVPAQAEPPVSAETRPAVDLKEVVRANLHAAAQHAILGHEGSSFRECSSPSCRNASNLIPYPVTPEPGMTEADLKEIFDKVVPAALEKAVASHSPAQMAPESQNEPAFIS